MVVNLLAGGLWGPRGAVAVGRMFSVFYGKQGCRRYFARTDVGSLFWALKAVQICPTGNMSNMYKVPPARLLPASHLFISRLCWPALRNIPVTQSFFTFRWSTRCGLGSFASQKAGFQDTYNSSSCRDATTKQLCYFFSQVREF